MSTCLALLLMLMQPFHPLEASASTLTSEIVTSAFGLAEVERCAVMHLTKQGKEEEILVAGRGGAKNAAFVTDRNHSR